MFLRSLIIFNLRLIIIFYFELFFSFILDLDFIWWGDGLLVLFLILCWFKDSYLLIIVAKFLFSKNNLFLMVFHSNRIWDDDGVYLLYVKLLECFKW